MLHEILLQSEKKKYVELELAKILYCTMEWQYKYDTNYDNNAIHYME
jgi:hypothetical protein